MVSSYLVTGSCMSWCGHSLANYDEGKGDDIKESGKILYEAKGVMLCYNEVSLRGQQATVHYNRPDNPDKQPVYEVHVGKNKFSSYKGRMFFEFIPECASFREVSAAGVERYSQMVNG